MEKFTKEQTRLFTIVAAIVMLLAYFVFKSPGYTLWEGLTKGHPNFFGYVFLILLLLAPFYLIIYAFRDEKALEPIKPITNISPKIAYAIPAVIWGVFILYTLIDEGAASTWVYLLGVCGAIYIGQKN